MIRTLGAPSRSKVGTIGASRRRRVRGSNGARSGASFMVCAMIKRGKTFKRAVNQCVQSEHLLRAKKLVEAILRHLPMALRLVALFAPGLGDRDGAAAGVGAGSDGDPARVDQWL